MEERIGYILGCGVNKWRVTTLGPSVIQSGNPIYSPIIRHLLARQFSMLRRLAQPCRNLQFTEQDEIIFFKKKRTLIIFNNYHVQQAKVEMQISAHTR